MKIRVKEIKSISIKERRAIALREIKNIHFIDGDIRVRRIA